MQNSVRLISSSYKVSNFFRSIHSSAVFKMPIKVGETVPNVDLYEGNPGNKVNIGEFCKNKKVLIFGVPGAFTPNCSKTHLPGYIEKAADIKAKGYEIICVSVNDPFVMEAWGKSMNAEGKVKMLADTNAEFTKAADLGIDLSGPLGSLRSKRFSLAAENGIVSAIEVEPDGTGLTCSVASNFLQKLK